jgi:hypothetical protein
MIVPLESAEILLSQTCLDCPIIELYIPLFLTNSKKSVINRVRVSTRGHHSLVICETISRTPQ